jgi:hypothetical protein
MISRSFSGCSPARGAALSRSARFGRGRFAAAAYDGAALGVANRGQWHDDAVLAQAGQELLGELHVVSDVGF